MAKCHGQNSQVLPCNAKISHTSVAPWNLGEAVGPINDVVGKHEEDRNATVDIK